MTTATLESPKTLIEQTLVESFWRADDGFWYPRAPGLAVVRLFVGERVYGIQRRRDSQTVWTKLVEASFNEFNPQTFRTWAENWTLTR